MSICGTCSMPRSPRGRNARRSSRPKVRSPMPNCAPQRSPSQRASGRPDLSDRSSGCSRNAVSPPMRACSASSTPVALMFRSILKCPPNVAPTSAIKPVFPCSSRTSAGRTWRVHRSPGQLPLWWRSTTPTRGSPWMELPCHRRPGPTHRSVAVRPTYCSPPAAPARQKVFPCRIAAWPRTSTTCGSCSGSGRTTASRNCSPSPST